MTALSDLIARLEKMPKDTPAAWCQNCGFIMANGEVFIKPGHGCISGRQKGTTMQAIAALKAREAAR